MKSLKALLLLGVLFSFASCGSDDGDCVAADWIGTYVLDADTQNCASEDVELSDTITITAGTDENSINFDGINAEVTGCNIEATDPFFGLTIEADLDGDEISVSGFGCTGTFIRQ